MACGHSEAKAVPTALLVSESRRIRRDLEKLDPGEGGGERLIRDEHGGEQGADGSTPAAPRTPRSARGICGYTALVDQNGIPYSEAKGHTLT
jgi:hypothetical protein